MALWSAPREGPSERRLRREAGPAAHMGSLIILDLDRLVVRLTKFRIRQKQEVMCVY